MTHYRSNPEKYPTLNKKVNKWVEVDTKYMNQRIHTL